MKNFYLYLLAIPLFFMISCGGDDDDPKDPENPVIEKRMLRFESFDNGQLTYRGEVIYDDMDRVDSIHLFDPNGILEFVYDVSYQNDNFSYAISFIDNPTNIENEAEFVMNNGQIQSLIKREILNGAVVNQSELNFVFDGEDLQSFAYNFNNNVMYTGNVSYENGKASSVIADNQQGMEISSDSLRLIYDGNQLDSVHAFYKPFDADQYYIEDMNELIYENDLFVSLKRLNYSVDFGVFPPENYKNGEETLDFYKYDSDGLIIESNEGEVSFNYEYEDGIGNISDLYLFTPEELMHWRILGIFPDIQ